MITPGCTQERKIGGQGTGQRDRDHSRLHVGGEDRRFKPQVKLYIGILQLLCLIISRIRLSTSRFAPTPLPLHPLLVSAAKVEREFSLAKPRLFSPGLCSWGFLCRSFFFFFFFFSLPNPKLVFCNKTMRGNIQFGNPVILIHTA